MNSSKSLRSLLAMAVLVVGLPLITLIPDADPVEADPAANAANVSQSSTGALSGGSVPDGTCSARITAPGGGGASGGLALLAVSVTDPLPGLSAASCPAATLAPAASTTCTATYRATQADVDAGSIANTATATGTPPVGPPVTDTGSATVTAVKGPAATIAKSTTATTSSAVGQQIAFTLNARNTGNVTLTNLVVTDPNAAMGTCTPALPATLAPGATITCSAVHTVTQADLTALSISNTAHIAADAGVADVTGTSNVVIVPGALPPAIPRAGYGISEPLKLVGLLLTAGFGLLIVSKRRRQFYLVLAPL